MIDVRDKLPAGSNMFPLEVIPPGATILSVAPKLVPEFSPANDMLPATLAVNDGAPVRTVSAPKLSVPPDAVLPLTLPVE